MPPPRQVLFLSDRRPSPGHSSSSSAAEDANIIGVSCIVMGLLLIAAERFGRHHRCFAHARVFDGLTIRLSQVGTLIPGVARSGATLAAARFLGFEHQDTAYFSFLLGLPAALLAGLKEIYELPKAHLDAYGRSVPSVGLIVGSVSTFAVIALLMRIIERFATWPFAVHRIILGALLLAGGAAGYLH